LALGVGVQGELIAQGENSFPPGCQELPAARLFLDVMLGAALVQSCRDDVREIQHNNRFETAICASAPPLHVCVNHHEDT
jgi:hypothetical protein